MGYIYRVSRSEPREEPKVEAKKDEGEEPSYRDLQTQAKELGIPANQSADDLKKAIDEAEHE